ncbi:S8 family peptidase [Mucilaginibacter sp. Bleaf8]|nr:S8 family peptidase [Mucilaginibacter sp. Bleaf8]
MAVQAQAPVKAKENWQNLDFKTDSVFGISTEKAYAELLKGKKSKPVLVAVIDGGVDIKHEDLKQVIWNNPKEKAGNGKDDDKNGYIDDLHGWDFIGGAKGAVHWDNVEAVRLLRKYQAQFANTTDSTKLSADQRVQYRKYLKVKSEVSTKLTEAQQSVQGVGGFKRVLEGILTKLNNQNPTLADFQKFEPAGDPETRVVGVVSNLLPQFKDFKDFKRQVIDEAYDHYDTQVKYHYNVDFDSRSIVGDNYANSNERNYGNADVAGPDADHGSHVSGIIGAVRNNNLGIKGVADNVMIMSVRTVPDGDERDKDVANAIRYAAANGAKVINMSFGKGYSPDKKAVDEAIKFAISKDVLLIHAAGNDNLNLEVDKNFPTPIFLDGSKATAWIEVGASGPQDDKTLKAAFSNYGKNTVDVFAPGVDINSTVPGSKYDLHSGTSMAAPVVAGLAALIRSYYPKLSAMQVKDIILKSVVKIDHPITLKDGANDKEVAFADLCKTGGIVNAYNALKLAATY